MQTCGGATVMGSLQQQLILSKGTSLDSKLFRSFGFSSQVLLNSVKSYRVNGIRGSMVTGRPPSSVSMSVPENIGNYTLTFIF